MSQHDTLTLEPIRAAFERYFLQSRKSKGANRKPTFERFEDGAYKDDHTQRHWWTWQNALSATQPAQAAQGAGEVVAWCTPDGERCVTAKTYECARKDSGAMWSSMAPFTVPAYTHPTPAQPAPVVPEGWKLVPVEPTEEMLAAAHEGDRQYTLRNFGDVMTVMQGPYDHWVAMLAATPTPPAQAAADAERIKALAYCDEVERQIMEVANGKRKPTKVEFQPIGRLIEFIRNGKTYDVSLSYNPDAALATHQQGGK